MSPAEIAAEMMKEDAFSQWLGIQILEIKAGRAVLQLTVRPDMLNGFRMAHGGISFSLADSALAFASNSRGQLAVSIETRITHHLPVKVGDLLTATASEQSLGHKVAHYSVWVHNQREELVASFSGTVYRKKERWGS